MQKACYSFVTLALFFNLLCGHIIFTMEPLAFDKFSDLLPELQWKIFAHSLNKTSFQGINKKWAQQASIKNIVFSEHFRDAMYACEKGQNRLIGILLHAGHTRNYEGVENILKNSGILERVANRSPYLVVGEQDGIPVVLDLWDIADQHSDERLKNLLTKYKYPSCTLTIKGRRLPRREGFMTSNCGLRPGQLSECSLVFPIRCIAGDSEEIQHYINYSYHIDKSMVERCLNIAIDFDHGKCINALFCSLYGLRFKKTHDFLKRACVQHSMNALEVLLQKQSSVINQLFSFPLLDSSKAKRGISDSASNRSGTLLDFAIENAQEDSGYNKVIEILKNHDAKTEAEIISIMLE